MTEQNRIELFKEIMQGVEISDDFIKWLVEAGFFSSPASTKYHGAYEGGLFDHSYEVTKALLRFTERLPLEWENPFSPHIVGMFHDLCKIGTFEKQYLRHGEESVEMLSKWLMLNEEETLCILHHMGAYVNDRDKRDAFGNSIEKYPNVLWTHTADMYAARFLNI